MSVKWVVQNNLCSIVETGDNKRIEDICRKHGFGFEGVKVIPFSGIIPEFDFNVPTIPYGGTGWINNIYIKYPNHRGIFFNPESVFTNWLNKYKTLNYGALETTFGEVADALYLDDDLLFIRPVSDQKEFSGGVMLFKDIKQWRDKIITDVIELKDLPIIVHEPYQLSHEWRAFVLSGKVITGSQYRTYHVLNTKAGLPQDVLEFVEEQAKIYSPAEVFVMDVCKTAGELYVLEVGCFNSAGFYESDLERIVCEVSNYVEKL
jgi:hypothetical protein